MEQPHLLSTSYRSVLLRCMGCICCPKLNSYTHSRKSGPTYSNKQQGLWLPKSSIHIDPIVLVSTRPREVQLPPTQNFSS
ncbi:hypothetical protein Mapa_016130 [Marchantia paleacea]|nr:hypothetical protein Mapa_016130 [Marchantia paleacea]